MPVPKVCQHCQVAFSVPTRRHETVKFCSRACKTAAGRITYDCIICKKSFEQPKSDSKTPRKYCSNACYDMDRKGKEHAKRSDVIHTKDCEVCGVNFRVTLTRKDTARFCSRKCQSASPEFKAECSARQAGEKAWRWTGGVYKNQQGYMQERHVITGVRNLTHRNMILDALLLQEPDHKFIVEKNGVKRLDSRIEVHHIDRNRANNAIENLLAVTKDAHAQIHHRNKKPEPWECWPSDPPNW